MNSKKKNKGSTWKSVNQGSKGGWGYETFMSTSNYHIISGRVGLEKLQFSVERNDKSHLDYLKQKTVVPNIRKATFRKPITSDNVSCNSGRFDYVEKSSLSSSKNQMTLMFNK